jgi:hypothetical protein
MVWRKSAPLADQLLIVREERVTTLGETYLLRLA